MLNGSDFSDGTGSSSLWSDTMLVEKINPIVDVSSDLTRKSFQEEFSSLIIKSDNLKSFITPDINSVILDSTESSNPTTNASKFKAFSPKYVLLEEIMF